MRLCFVGAVIAASALSSETARAVFACWSGDSGAGSGRSRPRLPKKPRRRGSLRGRGAERYKDFCGHAEELVAVPLGRLDSSHAYYQTSHAEMAPINRPQVHGAIKARLLDLTMPLLPGPDERDPIRLESESL